MIEGAPERTGPEPPHGERRAVALFVRDVVLIAVAYLVAGRLGLMVASIGDNITLVWLPTGIAVAALYRLGLRHWPGVTLGALFVNVMVGTPLWVSLAMATGNTLSPVLTVVILRRLGFRDAFDRSRDILLLCLAALAGMVLSASSGVSALSLAGLLPTGRGVAWFVWWAGDVMGTVAVGPLLLSFNRRELRAIVARRAEFLALSTLTGLAVWAVFVFNRGPNGQALSLAFVPLPFVAWGALRFGAVGASLTMIGVFIGAAYGTANGTGPFYREAPLVGPFAHALYLATSAVLGWMITALNLARLVATDRQRLLERALSDVSLGVLLSDADRTITYANLGFTRLTGYSEGELLGQSCRVLQGPLTDPDVARELKASLHQHRRFEGDILNYRKDGTPFWNALLISPVLDEHGKAAGFLGVLRNVTRQRNAEAALQESSKRLDDVLNAIENVVYSSTPDGSTLLFISGAAETLYGRPVSEFMTDALARQGAVHHDDRARAEAAWRQVRESGRFDVDYRLIRADGSQRWVRDHGRVALDETGQPCRIDGVVTDITARRSAEEDVLQNAERLRLALAASNQGLFDLDVSTGATVVNEEFARLLGYDPTDFVETNAAWRERLHPSE